LSAKQFTQFETPQLGGVLLQPVSSVKAVPPDIIVNTLPVGTEQNGTLYDSG
jgi:hypothetical protein